MPISLDVTFALIELDGAPVAGGAARLVFGSDANWQDPEAGQRFVTDAKGEHRFTAQVAFDKRRRKMPTNFWTSLVTRPVSTDHLMVAAEFEFLGCRWLHAADLYCFPGTEDVVLDGLAVYVPDSRGRFTARARHAADGWTTPWLGDLVLTTPGHELWNFTLARDPGDPSGTHWSLRLGFKRAPAPVRR